MCFFIIALAQIQANYHDFAYCSVSVVPLKEEYHVKLDCQDLYTVELGTFMNGGLWESQDDAILSGS